MNLSLAMPTQPYSQSNAMKALDDINTQNLSDSELDHLEEAIGWREDVLERLKTVFDASNIMGIDTAYTHAIANLAREDRNELFKALVYASNILAKKMFEDPRNAKAVELFKNLAQSTFNQSLTTQDVEPAKLIKLQDYDQKRMEEISAKLAALFNELKNFRAKHTFSSAEFGAIFATALIRQHNTLQQVIVKCIVTAMQSIIFEEKNNPTETDQDVLAIYAEINRLNSTIYFPCI